MRNDHGETGAPGCGLARSLLGEISEHLAGLIKTGEPAAIDLRSLPMTASDRSELEERLGRGEVAATLNVAGASEIWETRYSGVWWVRHRGADDKIAAERIEIAAVPEILVAQEGDMAAAAARMSADLAADPPGIEEHRNDG